VETSISRGTLASVSGSAVSSAAHSSGSAAFFAPAIGDLAVQAPAAADEEFVHEAVRLAQRAREDACRGAGARPTRGSPRVGQGWWGADAAWAADSAGVSVFIDSAWICSRILSPERGVDARWWRRTRGRPSNAAETMVA
jgi:hypothetical protein